MQKKQWIATRTSISTPFEYDDKIRIMWKSFHMRPTSSPYVQIQYGLSSGGSHLCYVALSDSCITLGLGNTDFSMIEKLVLKVISQKLKRDKNKSTCLAQATKIRQCALQREYSCCWIGLHIRCWFHCVHRLSKYNSAGRSWTHHATP